MNRPIQSPPTHVNGLELAALQEVAHTFVEHPDRALAEFSTRTDWTGGLATRSRVDQWVLGGQAFARTFVVDSDEPIELLGAGSAPNPQELLLSAIASCMVVTYVVTAASMGIEVAELSIELGGTLDLRGPMGLVDEVARGFPDVRCRVRVRADACPDRLVALHDQVLANSANVDHLTRSVPLQAELVIDAP